MFSKILNRNQNEKGATVIEYALIVAGIAVAISAVVFAFGGSVTSMFKDSEAVVVEETAAPAPEVETQSATEEPVAETPATEAPGEETPAE